MVLAKLLLELKALHLLGRAGKEFLVNKVSRRHIHQILQDLLLGYDWQHTGHFPRITHCDFSQRKSGSFNVRHLRLLESLKTFTASSKAFCAC